MSLSLSLLSVNELVESKEEALPAEVVELGLLTLSSCPDSSVLALFCMVSNL